MSFHTLVGCVDAAAAADAGVRAVQVDRSEALLGRSTTFTMSASTATSAVEAERAIAELVGSGLDGVGVEVDDARRPRRLRRRTGGTAPADAVAAAGDDADLVASSMCAS